MERSALIALLFCFTYSPLWFEIKLRLITTRLDLLQSQAASESPSKGVASIRNYGAIGDGAHDDAEAFDEALKQTSGVTINVPPGNFRLSHDVNDKLGRIAWNIDGGALFSGPGRLLMSVSSNSFGKGNDVRSSFTIRRSGSTQSPVQVGIAPIQAYLTTNDPSNLYLHPGIYGQARKESTNNHSMAVGLLGDGFDDVGGSTTFVEGVRGMGTVTRGQGGSAYGGVSIASRLAGTNSDRGYTIGHEAEAYRADGPDAPRFGKLDPDHFATTFLATARSYGPARAAKPDAAFMTNPYNDIGFETGFLNGLHGADGTAFANAAHVKTGLDLSNGSYNEAQIRLASRSPVVARTDDNVSDMEVLSVNSQTLFLGKGVSLVQSGAPFALRVYWSATLPTKSVAGALAFCRDCGLSDSAANGNLVFSDGEKWHVVRDAP